MTEPMKIRARQKANLTEIRVLVNHPMETGLRKDNDGKLVPTHYIQLIKVSVAGKLIVQGETATSIAKNPVFAFRAVGYKVGDEVIVEWIDNFGETRSDKTTIIAG